MQKSSSHRFRIVFMGTPVFAVPSLKALVEGPDAVLAVVTQPDRPRGRGRRVVPSPVKEFALASGIPVLQPERARDPGFITEVAALEPDLLVVAAYGQILPPALLHVPRIMPINVHGSLLPAYRGAAPIQWAIMNCEKETGITIMRMDAGMDTGPMLLSRAIGIGPDETFGELYLRMSDLGARLLREALDLMGDDRLTEISQPEEGITYAPPIRPETACIDWTLPSERIACLIRAMDPEPGAHTLLEGKRIRLFRPFIIEEGKVVSAVPGEIVRADDAGLFIATGEGIVGVREILYPGKKRLRAGDFLRGRPISPGVRLGE